MAGQLGRWHALNGDFLIEIVMLVGAITGAITTPLDVIKTRLMVQVVDTFYSFLLCFGSLIVAYLHFGPQWFLMFLLFVLRVYREQQNSIEVFPTVSRTLSKKKDLLLLWRFDHFTWVHSHQRSLVMFFTGFFTSYTTRRSKLARVSVEYSNRKSKC